MTCDDRPSEVEIEGLAPLGVHGLDWDRTATICPMTDEPCRDPRCYESGCEAEREEELG